MRQAIIDDTHIYTARKTAGLRVLQKWELNRVVYNVADIVEICRPHKIESVWVMPGSKLSQAARKWFFQVDETAYKVWFDPASAEDESEDIYTVRFRDDPDSDHIAYASARRQKVDAVFEADINIMYPEWGTWQEDATGQKWALPGGPRDLLATVLYLSDAFGLAACISPGNMGKRLMQSLSRERLNERIDTSDIPFSDMTMDYIWMRRPSPEERKMKFVHQYDKNRAYTGAAQSVRVGIGDPRYVEGDGYYHKHIVGIWHVSINTSNSLYNNDVLPCPIRADREWASTDLIEAARAVGVHVDVHAGYMWEESAKTLDKWAKHMWLASAALRDNKDNQFPHAIARENAYRTSKLKSNATIGRLNREYSKELYRPDINRLIIQKARANGTHTMEKYRKLGYMPAHVYKDSYYFFSNEEDPAVAVPGMLQYSQELRGYKHEHTYPVCPELLWAFAVGAEKGAAKGHGILKRMKEGR